MENLIVQTEDKELALANACKISINTADLVTVIECRRSKKFYVEEGDGGMLRNFESVTAKFNNGKKIYDNATV